MFRSRPRRSPPLAACLALACLLASPALGGDPDGMDLTELSIEQLMDLQVVSASKTEESLSRTPAAVFVITADDIRRSGATSIAELLRMVPGMYVARISSNIWAVSARGFTDRFANKLLVLVDGRSVYSPIFSGVFWESLDTLLEDIERIEVIRGPGGTLWGANAVNGIVNIITRHSRDTQGGLVSGGGGSEERGFAHARYGGRIDENLTYRVYAKWSDRASSELEEGGKAYDAWEHSQGGFRLDGELSEEDTLLVEGDAFRGSQEQDQVDVLLGPPYVQRVRDTARVEGANLLARWTRSLADDSDLSLQGYVDHYDLEQVLAGLRTTTVDLDLQHRLGRLGAHDIIWGLGYRLINDDFQNTSKISLDPESDTYDVLSGFLQDRISILPDRLRLTLGSKFEHNDFSGFEVQPSIRALFTPDDKQTIWAAVTRAVRTPSRVDRDLRLNLPAPPDPETGMAVVPAILGDKDIRSEKVLAFELGYRTLPVSWLSLDVTGFVHEYDDLRTVNMGDPFLESNPPPAHIVTPLPFGNDMSGTSYGVEVAGDARVAPWWKLQASYSFLRLHLDPDPEAIGSLVDNASVDTPRNLLSLRSSWNLPGALRLDAWVRYADTVPGQSVDSYLELDGRLAWKVREDLELFVVGQNLLDDSHLEFQEGVFGVPRTEVERGVYAGFTLRF